jgi:hypothetical protein
MILNSDEVRKTAFEQGLVIVQVSPYRYIAVRISPHICLGRNSLEEKHFHTKLDGDIVCGPAKWEDVAAYIQRHAIWLTENGERVIR